MRLCQPKENHAMSFILFHSRKLLVSCDVDKDCPGSQCCRDSRCTSECGVDILPYISFYFVLLGLLFMAGICSCVCQQRIKNALATRRTDRLQPFIQYMVLYYAEMSRAEESPVDPPGHFLNQYNTLLIPQNTRLIHQSTPLIHKNALLIHQNTPLFH